MSAIKRCIIAGQIVPVGYNLKNGCLLYKERLVLPKKLARIPWLIHEFHSSRLGGHSMYIRTYKRLAANIYREGMKHDVQEFVAKCDICQRNKYQAMSPVGLLQPLPILKYAHFLPLSHPFTAKTMAAVFTKEIVRLHEFPKSIVSDRDQVFITQLCREIFKAMGTTLNYSSRFYLETDGQTKVVSRTLEVYLRCFTTDKPKHW